MYSNCLFEAIKAKIKDPKNVYIFRVPKRFGGGATHFMWYDGKKYYHSVMTDRTNVKWYKKLWHNQEIKEIDEAIFNAFILNKISVLPVEKVRKTAKQLKLRIMNISGNYHHSTPHNPILPNIEDVEFLRKVFRKEPKFKVVKYFSISDRNMQILTYDELIKSINERVTLDWKIIGIYEEEFAPLYKRCCSFATADFLNGNE